MSAVAEVLKKLSVKPGDILVVGDWEVREQLLRMKPPPEINFYVPVIFAEGADIHKARREDLEDALRRMDAEK